MSWDILYNRQFVRVNDIVIPMILSGSNNCYEVGRNNRNGRRARDWWRHRYYLEAGALGIKPEDLELKLDAEFNDYLERYKDEADKEKLSQSWGYYTGIRLRTNTRTTFNQYKAFYMNGCKEAMSVEELVQHGVYMSIGVYRYADEDILKRGLKILPTVTIETTQQLIDTYKVYADYYGYDSVIVTFHNEYSIERMIEKLRKRNKKERKCVETTEFFALKAIGCSQYYVKGQKRGYRYAYTSTGGKKFLTEGKANSFLKRIKYKDSFEVVKCNVDYPTSVSI